MHNHGGARKGAGRKPDYGDRGKPRSVSLTDEQWDALASVEGKPAKTAREILARWVLKKR